MTPIKVERRDGRLREEIEEKRNRVWSNCDTEKMCKLSSSQKKSGRKIGRRIFEFDAVHLLVYFQTLMLINMTYPLSLFKEVK